jgi:RND family efflux transporter MFP subunit
MIILLIFVFFIAFSWTATPANSANTAELDCMIEAHQIVEIRNPAEGIIKEILVDRGDLVEKEQILVVLESGPEKAAVDLWRFRSNMNASINAAEARLDFSEKKEKRMKELYKEDFVSLSEKEEAEAEKRLAEAQYHEAIENKKLAELELQRAVEVLNMRTIRSPFSGLVMERFLHPGAVTLNDEKKPILKIAEINPLYVEVMAPISMFGKINEGSKIKVIPEIPRGTNFTAIVQKVDRIVDAPSGTFSIRAELPNTNFQIPAGIKCKAKFRLK